MINFEYDALLTNIEGRNIMPTITRLRNKGTGVVSVPAQITGITEYGEITEYTVVTEANWNPLPSYKTTTIPATDLKYFGLEPMNLPDTVIANGKVAIQVRK